MTDQHPLIRHDTEDKEADENWRKLLYDQIAGRSDCVGLGEDI